MDGSMTLITRRRMLPAPGTVHVSPGDRVEHDTIVGEVGYSLGMPHFVNVARLLGERPENLITDHFIVSVGDEVRAGDTVARLSRRWGFSRETREASAPVAGVVERVLPELGLLSIRSGETTPAAGVVAVPVAAPLRCRGGEITPFMRVGRGDRVSQGQLLAVREEGAATHVARSSHDGVVDEIDVSEGTVILRRRDYRQVVRAFIPGRVQRVIPGRGAVIATRGAVIRGVFGAGGESVGAVSVVDSSTLRSADIGRVHRGCVVVAPGRLSLDALLEAHEAGVRAVVGASAMAADMVHLLGEELGRGVTGSESLEFTVVLTEGFGRFEMDADLWGVLCSLGGSMACVRGETHLRAGVIRPEVIVPGAASDVATDRGPAQLRTGARVRIVREPGLMRRGSVEHLMDTADIGNGLRAPALRVRLDDGSALVVLQANVEVIP